jgi:hypothetical protein
LEPKQFVTNQIPKALKTRPSTEIKKEKIKIMYKYKNKIIGTVINIY